MVDPFNYIYQGKQVIIPSLKFMVVDTLRHFILLGLAVVVNKVWDQLITQIQHKTVSTYYRCWRPSGGNSLSIAANFTATLAATYNTPVTASVSVDTPVPFLPGDVLGFTPGPGFYFQVANTPNQQSPSHMYYTYDSFENELMTAGSNNRDSSSPIISVEVEHVTHSPMKYSPYT